MAPPKENDIEPLPQGIEFKFAIHSLLTLFSGIALIGKFYPIGICDEGDGLVHMQEPDT